MTKIIEIKDKTGYFYEIEPEEMAEFNSSACKEIVSTVHPGIYRVKLWNGDYIEVFEPASVRYHPE